MQLDLRKLNSLTKYPSIPTLHVMDGKGKLTDELAVDFGGEDVLVTEKIDGTNARIIAIPPGVEVVQHKTSFSAQRWWYLIGSRNEILHAQFDLVPEDKQNIVTIVRDVAERWVDKLNSILEGIELQGKAICALYGEAYGWGIQKAGKQYATQGLNGFRMFDHMHINLIDPVFEKAVEEISSWRDAGGQEFDKEAELLEVAKDLGVSTTPRRGTLKSLPTAHAMLFELLGTDWFTTQAPIAGADSAEIGGRAEGVVVRTFDRRKIAKVRYDDYRRVLRGGKR